MPKDPSIDPLLDQLIESIPKCGQVQYSTKEQLQYLHRIAVRVGLYDAADLIRKSHLENQ